MDILQPEQQTAAMMARSCGCDIWQSQPDTTVEIGQTELARQIEAFGPMLVRSVLTRPAHAEAQRLEGISGARGSRNVASHLLAEIPLQSTVLVQLLDDVPLATVIGEYPAAVVRTEGGPQVRPIGRELRADLCAGFQIDGTKLTYGADHHITPAPIGPAADPPGGNDCWPGTIDLAPQGMRRHRQLGVGPSRQPADSINADAWSRDSFQHSTRGEVVLHEYELHARVDHEATILLDVEVSPYVLPRNERTQAIPSSRRLIGVPVMSLRDNVRSGFHGPGTCIHLSDLFGPLADAPTLDAQAHRAAEQSL